MARLGPQPDWLHVRSWREQTWRSFRGRPFLTPKRSCFLSADGLKATSSAYCVEAIKTRCSSRKQISLFGTACAHC